MKFICAQPAINYYTWQVEVMIDNFLQKGVNPEDIHIICGYGKEGVAPGWAKLKNRYTDVKFFFYQDTRFKPTYISSIRPNILHQHWLRNPELEKETVFYHDSDIMFSTNISEFLTPLASDDVCYLSDTVSYIGANYVRSKGEHYLDTLTGLTGVNKQYVIEQENNSGGAQYLLKNIPAKFWEKVYYDCENIWRVGNEMIRKDKEVDPKIHEIQIWCADMWAVLWNLFIWDKKVEVTKTLDFSWGTSHMDEYNRCNIYHNAGVTADRRNELFFKGDYINKLPYSIKLEGFNTNYGAYKYAEQIVKTAETTVLL
jgi:hypothetical protein